jgi:acyl phosphate:glycerol-3-phosphate acyltransferase
VPFVFILLLIGAYLLGSVPTGYLAARWVKGIDIREHGTGKVGASNVLRSASKWLAIPVALFDIGKGMLPVWIAQLLGMNTAMQVTAGLCAVIGHNWPVFLGFRGGRGILTSLGVVLMFSPWLGVIAAAIAYSLIFFKEIALGVVIGLICLPILSWFLAAPLHIADRITVTLGLIAMLGIALIRRLATSRTPISQSAPLGELIINRLLFDRDVRDRKLWVKQAASNGTKEEPKTR